MPLRAKSPRFTEPITICKLSLENSVRVLLRVRLSAPFYSDRKNHPLCGWRKKSFSIKTSFDKIETVSAESETREVFMCQWTRIVYHIQNYALQEHT